MKVDFFRKLNKAICVFSIVSGIFLFFSFASAGSLIDSTDGSYKTGDYTKEQVLAVLPRAVDIMLGVSGSIALLAFVYGGVLFLISSGNKETVEKGKSVLKSAVIGILLVFLSYAIIATVISTMCAEGACTGWSNYKAF